MAKKIIYFTKYPRIGKVKTRLAASIGNNKSFAIYNLLIKENWQVLKNSNAILRIEFTPSHMSEQIKEMFPEAAEYSEQSGKSIGERMAYAFEKAFNGKTEQVILLGSDLVDLLPGDIETAFQQLNEHDAVIGPSLDGGYYLIGFNFNVFQKTFFQKINWDDEDVFQQTINIIHDHGLSLYVLPQRIDIDTIDDIHMFLGENKAENEFIDNLKKIISED